MSSDFKEISVRGKLVEVPCVQIDGRAVVVTGRFVRIATIHDESFVEGDVVPDPARFLSDLRTKGLRADVLTFAEKLDQNTPRHPYGFEWDNAAVARTTSFTDWWDKLPQETRKNVRRAAKRGLSVRVATFDDQFVSAIKAIYDETPIRQGRQFWHFGKDLETVKADNSSYLDRSEFLGAYDGAELVGFMKFVYVGPIAEMMQILSKSSHYDKRPMNALIAKAVEVCHEKGVSFLVYSKFTFGNKTNSDIAEFKRRNGFVQMDFPRYYVPLTAWGRLAFALGLHRGLLGLLPSGVLHVLGRIRAGMLQMMPTGRPLPAASSDKSSESASEVP